MLLDTHTLLWHDQNDRRLRPGARRAIERAYRTGDVRVSVVTFLEVGMLFREGKLDFISDVEAWRESLFEADLVELPVTGWIATQAGLLPDLHGDLMDRIIIATALHGNHELATADQKILEWRGPLRRLPAGR